MSSLIALTPKSALLGAIHPNSHTPSAPYIDVGSLSYGAQELLWVACRILPNEAITTSSPEYADISSELLRHESPPEELTRLYERIVDLSGGNIDKTLQRISTAWCYTHSSLALNVLLGMALAHVGGRRLRSWMNFPENSTPTTLSPHDLSEPPQDAS
ncbi:MAG: hypothetical protein LBI20_02120 [Holosporales bacterium]|nr:hypothetical protein [Holosporales bacterium]